MSIDINKKVASHRTARTVILDAIFRLRMAKIGVKIFKPIRRNVLLIPDSRFSSLKSYPLNFLQGFRLLFQHFERRFSNSFENPFHTTVRAG